jgi:hypothetical protein
MAMRFPSGALEIRIENPGGVGSGVREILVDDQRLVERTVRIPVDGHEHQVVVRLGESSESGP